jgi:protein required for attachment to host cells
MAHLNKSNTQRTESVHATWIVVADAGRARIFSVAAHGGTLDEFVDLINPLARLQDHDELADRRGRMAQGNGRHGSSPEPRQTHGEHVSETFAKELSQRLEAGRRHGDVAKIYLLADPHFLGLLRAGLDPATAKLVVWERAADLSRSDVADIRNALPAQL